jgi:atypical dual specificity phosphatase
MSELAPYTWIDGDRLLASWYPQNEQEWLALHALGVTVVINLTEQPHRDSHSLHLDMTEVHIPVPDMTAPTPRQIESAVSAIDLALAENKVVAVHCHAGLGRTGTVLACWLVRTGMDAPKAVAQIRSLRPGSVETDEQLAAVAAYAGRVSKIRRRPLKDSS